MPSSFGVTVNAWPGKRAQNASSCASRGRLLERQHRPAVADRLAGYQLGRPRPLERVVGQLDLGVGGEQRPQLVLERVVVGVHELRQPRA